MERQETWYILLSQLNQDWLKITAIFETLKTPDLTGKGNEESVLIQ
jgi:hypothetical protein